MNQAGLIQVLCSYLPLPIGLLWLYVFFSGGGDHIKRMKSKEEVQLILLPILKPLHFAAVRGVCICGSRKS